MNFVSRNRGIISSVVASVLLSCAGPCFAQNVADAARQERERKQHSAHRANHVYTNEDLKHAQILVPEDRERALEARRNAASPAYNADNNSATPNAPETATGVLRGQPGIPAGPQISLLPFNLPQAQVFGEFAPAPSAPYFAARRFAVPTAPRVRRAHPFFDDALILELQSNQALPAAPEFPASLGPISSASANAVSAVPVAPAIPHVMSHANMPGTMATPRAGAIPAPATLRAPANKAAAPSLATAAPAIATAAPAVTTAPTYPAVPAPSAAAPAHTTLPAPHAAAPADTTRPLHSAAAPAHAQPHFVATAIAENTIRVQRGDSLWKLAQQHLGNGTRWHEIAALNPEIADPNVIQIGEELRIASPESLAAKRFIVQPGDTLSSVALNQFGNARAFTCIASANPNLHDANLIFAGQSLILPDNCPIVR